MNPRARACGVVSAGRASSGNAPAANIGFRLADDIARTLNTAKLGETCVEAAHWLPPLRRFAIAYGSVMAVFTPHPTR